MPAKGADWGVGGMEPRALVEKGTLVVGLMLEHCLKQHFHEQLY